mgnify:CR=1 FL=1
MPEIKNNFKRSIDHILHFLEMNYTFWDSSGELKINLLSEYDFFLKTKNQILFR